MLKDAGQVCALVREVLKDPGIRRGASGDHLPERDVLYEDPELGFCIRGHSTTARPISQPHDHGPSWAIYGQVAAKR